ncbi:MAG: glycosyltransferase family 4 protein [Flavobacteriaceae bacterium]|nr:glycosyltransferase family 4 protein [Flavobacteriaceae bacterium]
MNKKLHILFLCSWYPSEVFPTNGDFIQRHAEAVALQHRVSVLHMVSDKTISTSTIKIETINNVTSYIGYVKYTSNSVLKMLRFFAMYKRLLKKIGFFDLVHLNVLFPFGIFALHLKYFKKKTYLISEHWSGYLTANSKAFSWREKLISKYIVKKAKYICPVSTFLREEMQSIGFKGNYKVVPNVINTHIFKPSHSSKEENLTVVHISNFDTAKNVAEMLKAAKLLEDIVPNVAWKFIGGTGAAYQKLIANLDFKTANIVFINHLSQEALATHIQSATICVSFSKYETFGITTLEAISCGTQAITTNTGIVRELEKSNYLSVVNYNDVTGLTNKILEIYQQQQKENTTEMHRFIEAHFSPKVVSALFSDLYFKALY